MIYKIIAVCLCSAIIFAEDTSKAKEHRHHKSETISTLLKSYDRAVRAGFGQQPVTVNVSMFVAHMTWVKNDLTMTMYFRQHWTDNRLNQLEGGKQLTFHAEDVLPLIWEPDTYCHEATSEEILQRGFVRIEGGKVAVSQKMNLKVPCRASIGELYSNDGKLNCTITYESYGYSDDDIKYGWKEPKAVAVQEDMATKTGLNIIDIRLEEYSSHLRTGTYSRLKVTFEIQTVFRKQAFDYLSTESLQMIA